MKGKSCELPLAAIVLACCCMAGTEETRRRLDTAERGNMVDEEKNLENFENLDEKYVQTMFLHGT